MIVITLKEHNNQFGTRFNKPVDHVYEHPQPEADITFGYVREATDAEMATAAERAKRAREDAAGPEVAADATAPADEVKKPAK